MFRISACILVIDSIQTVYSPQLSSAPGVDSGQKTPRCYEIAKSRNATFIVDMLLKRVYCRSQVLEHMVDAVLYFEGSTSQLSHLRGVRTDLVPPTR